MAGITGCLVSISKSDFKIGISSDPDANSCDGGCAVEYCFLVLDTPFNPGHAVGADVTPNLTCARCLRCSEAYEIVVKNLNDQISSAN